MTADEEEFQGLPAGAEKEANFESRAAFKYILSQPADGNARVKVWPAKTFGQYLQGRFHPRHFRVAQMLERGKKARAEQDGGFSHVSVCP
jgi:hypothetical protein